MKNLTLLLVCMLGAFVGTAQITVSDYQVELSSAVDDVQNIPAITATSSCGEVTVDLKEQIFSGGCLGNLVRTYAFSDECGNIARAQQFIKLTDATPPVIEVATEANAEEGGSLAPTVTTSDNSGKPVELSYTEKRIGGDLVRIYTATDVCGNTTTREVGGRIAD